MTNIASWIGAALAPVPVPLPPGLTLQEADSGPEGHWVTMHGTHVFIDSAGNIVKGPKHIEAMTARINKLVSVAGLWKSEGEAFHKAHAVATVAHTAVGAEHTLADQSAKNEAHEKYFKAEKKGAHRAAAVHAGKLAAHYKSVGNVEAGEKWSAKTIAHLHTAIDQGLAHYGAKKGLGAAPAWEPGDPLPAGPVAPPPAPKPTAAPAAPKPAVAPDAHAALKAHVKALGDSYVAAAQAGNIPEALDHAEELAAAYKTLGDKPAAARWAKYVKGHQHELAAAAASAATPNAFHPGTHGAATTFTKNAQKDAQGNSIDASQMKHKVATKLGVLLAQAGITHEEAQATLDALGDVYYGSMNKSNHYVVANSIVGAWAGSSTDTSLKSIAFQLAANEELGIGAWQGELPQFLKAGPYSTEGGIHDRAMEALAKPGVRKTLRTLARQMYEHTQERLKAEGIQRLSLFRGMRAIKHPDLVAKFNAKAKEHGMVNGAISVITHLQPGQFEDNPIASWSSNLETSMGFTDGTPHSGWDGATTVSPMFMAEVPAADILCYFGTGLGCMGESEYVIKGVPRGATAIMSTSANGVRIHAREIAKKGAAAYLATSASKAIAA